MATSWAAGSHCSRWTPGIVPRISAPSPASQPARGTWPGHSAAREPTHTTLFARVVSVSGHGAPGMEHSRSARWMVEGRAGSAAAIREAASRWIAATSSARWTSASDESRATTGGPTSQFAARAFTSGCRSASCGDTSFHRGSPTRRHGGIGGAPASSYKGPTPNVGATCRSTDLHTEEYVKRVQKRLLKHAVEEAERRLRAQATAVPVPPRGRWLATTCSAVADAFAKMTQEQGPTGKSKRVH